MSRAMFSVLLLSMLLVPAPRAEAQSVEEARAALQLIEDVMATFQAAPAIEMRLRIESSMGNTVQDPEEQTALLGPGNQSMLATRVNELVATDGSFFVTSSRVEDKFVQVPIQGDPLTTLRALGSPQHFVPYALRYGRSVEEVLLGLSIGMPGRLRPSNVRDVTDNEGRALRQGTYVSPEGILTINVDPETMFIRSIVSDNVPTDAPVGNFHIIADITIDTVVHAKLPRPIDFEPGGRTAVDSFAAMLGRTKPGGEGAPTIAVGDAIPAFSLYTLEGTKMDSASLAGKVVVIDFWASWCVPCRRTLTVAHEIAAWAEKEGLPVAVVPLNGLEQNDDPGNRWDKAHTFWEEQEFSLQSLFDMDGSVTKSFGVSRIPVTLLVGPDGRVASVHTDTDEALGERLRAEILALLGK